MGRSDHSGKQRLSPRGADDFRTTPREVISAKEAAILAEVSDYTLTSRDRLLSTMDAVAYAIRRGVPGALVECGVWKGGSVLAMIRTLQTLGAEDRDIYLYDTFEGMTRPSEEDTSRFDGAALDEWERSTSSGSTPWSWAFNDDSVRLAAVGQLMASSGYPEEYLHFVQGDVEETLRSNVPPSVAVLRLDTDWYASTLAELTHLYPRLSPGGVLIIDDYGHWDGARKAVDEYFQEVEPPILLGRVDYTGRMGVKW